MKKHNIFSRTLLALAGVGLLAAHVGAAPLTVANGDLFLGFYTTGNGSTFDYVVNLGQAASLSGVSSITGIDTDLDGIFGNDWNTRDDVFWGVFGTTGTSAVGGDPRGTNWATKAEISIGTKETGFGRGSENAQQVNAGSRITDMRIAYANQLNSNGVNPKAAIQSLPLNNSFASFQTNGNLTSFVSYDLALGNFGAGVAGTALDLFKMNPAGGNTGVALGTPGDFVGTFTISNAGVLSFAAVPEPTTVALLAGAGAGLLLLARRRKSQKS